MRTGEVKDPGEGLDPYLETHGWTPWLYYVTSDDDLDRYHQAADALMMRFERMPSAVQRRQKRIEFRCPVKGCRLATVYWLQRRPTKLEAEHQRHMLTLRDENGQPRYKPYPSGDYLYLGRTSGNAEVYDILNYSAFSSPLRNGRYGCSCCRILFWRAGCQHGTATLERGIIYDMFSLANRSRRHSQTEEQAIAELPERLRPFWGNRVFHPEPAAWHPKKRAAGRYSRPINST